MKNMYNKVVLKRSAFDEQTESNLRIHNFYEPDERIKTLLNDTLNGKVQCFKVFADDVPIAEALFEIYKDGEFHLIAVTKIADVVNGTKKILPVIENYARKCNCTKITIQTRFAGMAEILNNLDYNIIETTHQKTL